MDLPKDALIKLTQKGHRIYISGISIFELSAKGAKHITSGTLAAERVTKGISSIIYDERITTIPMHDSALLLTAFKIRSMVSNFIDCLILSSAINQCDALVTEDDDIQNLRKNKQFSELLTIINPRFKIQTLSETL